MSRYSFKRVIDRVKVLRERARFFRELMRDGFPTCWRCKRWSRCIHELHEYVPFGERRWVNVCGDCREHLKKDGFWDRQPKSEAQR